MSKASRKSKPELRKTKPTIFPMGFAAGRIEGSSLIVIDFLDEIDGKTTILESVALPENRAIQLSKALKSALEAEEDEKIQE